MKTKIVLILAIIIAAIAGAHAQNSAIIEKWKVRSSPPTCIATSPEEEYTGCIGEDHLLRYMNQYGEILFTKESGHATDLIISENGECMITFAKFDPDEKAVLFLRANGQRIWQHEVQGQIIESAVSQDGKYAAIATDSSQIYIYTLHPRKPKYRRWNLENPAERITFIPGQEKIVVGTTGDPELICYNLRGGQIWSRKIITEHQYDLTASRDGKMILGVFAGSLKTQMISINMYTKTGLPLWRQTIKGYDACALISPDGKQVGISYATTIQSKKTEMLERRVAVYSTTGELLWEKGGLFFAPRLVAHSPAQSAVIVTDCENSLYSMDKTGKITSKITLGGNIGLIYASPHSGSIILYSRDGYLHAYTVRR